MSTVLSIGNGSVDNEDATTAEGPVSGSIGGGVADSKRDEGASRVVDLGFGEQLSSEFADPTATDTVSKVEGGESLATRGNGSTSSFSSAGDDSFIMEGKDCDNCEMESGAVDKGMEPLADCSEIAGAPAEGKT